ncbi:MAG: class I SAM-dependent methyltransferase [Phormidesmis sp. CAN_BIN36]|nr:class I SAM-dependent methyltransferase [Phormidesmis sp. CAN_BIN36]
MTSPVKPEAVRPVTPIGILVSHLQTAMQQLVDVPDLPPGLAANVQEALNLAQGLDSYISDCTTPESSALQAIAHQTSQEPWTQRFGQGETVRQLEQEMLSGHVEGQTLKMFVYMTRARRILDIGMFTGYSALAMAEALPPDGQLIACEVDSYVATFAQNLFQQSTHGSKIQIERGSALETLDRLASAGETFDLVFIDADKQEYVQYFQTLLDRNLLAPNGFICVDNTLFQGQVYLPKVERSPNGEAVAQFNQIVQQDDRVEQVLLPLRDGLTMIRRV